MFGYKVFIHLFSIWCLLMSPYLLINTTIQRPGPFPFEHLLPLYLGWNLLFLWYFFQNSVEKNFTLPNFFLLDKSNNHNCSWIEFSLLLTGRAAALSAGQREQCSGSPGGSEWEGDGAEGAEIPKGCRERSYLQGGSRGPAALTASRD